MAVVVVTGVLLWCPLRDTVPWVVCPMVLLHSSDVAAGMVQVQVAISSFSNYVEIISVAFSNVGSVADGHAAEEIVDH